MKHTTLTKTTASTKNSASTSNESSPSTHGGVVSHRRSRKFTIAIVTRAFAPAMQATIDGIVAHLNETAPGQFSCVFFNAERDEKRLLNYVTQIIQNYTMPYDAIVTIGALAGQVATRVSLLLNAKIPIIFSWVHNPTHLGMVYPGKRRTGNITGIATSWPDHSASLDVLKSLKKGVRRILLPYNPSGTWLSNQAAELTSLVASNGIEIRPLPIHNPSNAVENIKQHIHEVDTILTIRDQMIVSRMPTISSICNDYGVTIYTSDLESVEQGAAIGFSVKDDKAGTEIGEYIIHVFKDHAQPYELPVKTASTEHFIGINKQTSLRQGLELNENDLAQLKNKIVFDINEGDDDEKNNKPIKKN